MNPASNPELDWEILTERDLLDPAERAAMATGCHYDYIAQTWRDGHDHVHVVAGDDSSPLAFCGCDRVTCEGKVSA